MGYKHKATDANPWGLTLVECRGMTAIVRLGSTSDVAQERRTTRRNVQHHLTNAMKKMGVENRVQAAVAWDRRVREDHRFLGKRTSSVFALGLLHASEEMDAA